MKITVLVVEDDVEMRGACASALQRVGWVVHEAGTLRAAWRGVAEHRVDALLVDRTLPDGDGAELVEAGIPVVVLTGDERAVPGAAATLVKGDVTFPAIIGALAAAAAGAAAVWAEDC